MIESSDGACIGTEILEAASRGQVISLGTGKLTDQNIPCLVSGAGQADGERQVVGAKVLNGDVYVLTGENSAEVGGQDGRSHRISTAYTHRIVGAITR